MTEIVRTQVRLPKEIHDKAVNLALEQGISLNQLIVVSLREHLMKRAYSPTKVKEALELITYALEQSNNAKFNTKDD